MNKWLVTLLICVAVAASTSTASARHWRRHHHAVARHVSHHHRLYAPVPYVHAHPRVHVRHVRPYHHVGGYVRVAGPRVAVSIGF